MVNIKKAVVFRISKNVAREELTPGCPRQPPTAIILNAVVADAHIAIRAVAAVEPVR
jgi:hypothetical protein